MRDLEGFLTRESWEKDSRAAASQHAVERALADGRVIQPLCLEEVEDAFKRSHRGSKRTSEAWDVFKDENFTKPMQEFHKAITEISEQAYSSPITEDHWQNELKHRERIRQYLKR